MSRKILKGPDYHMELPDKSLGNLFYYKLQKYKDRPAFTDEYTGESITYNKFFEVTCKLAQVYKNIRLETGDRIAVYSENSIYYFLPVIAGLYLGITTVAISHYYLKNELAHALNLTKPSVLFCSKKNYREFLRIKGEFNFVKYVILTDFEEISNEVENFTSLIQKYGNGEFSGPVDLDVTKSVAFILFSSGTTGLPKGVMLTHKNFMCRIVHSWDPRLKYYDDGGVVLGYLPFYHGIGIITHTAALTFGFHIRVLWKFDERIFLSAIEKYRLTTLTVVPTIAIFLAKKPVVDEYDLSSLEDVIVGGAPVTESSEKRLAHRLKLKWVRQIYGMTESTVNFTIVPAGTWKKGSVGKLVPGTLAAVRDPESGKLLGSHEVGEIIVKGDLITPGYYDNPRANEESFLDDGFYRTGDLGYYDEEEYFYVVDRLKELIKYNAFQVAPAEIENLLLKHPKVLDAGVVGIPDEKAGELPMAFIVKQPDAEDLKAEEIVKYVSDHLSHQKWLRGGVKFVDAIPKNATGKILRRELRKMINNANLSKL